MKTMDWLEISWNTGEHSNSNMGILHDLTVKHQEFTTKHGFNGVKFPFQQSNIEI